MPSFLHRLLICACAAVGFAGFASAIHPKLPLTVPEVTPKLDYLKAHRAEYDTIFIGSSRIYHGVSPRTFDAVTAAAGKPTHSFNLAINDLLPPESLHMVRAMLAMRLPHLRTVFLEVTSAPPIPGPGDLTVRDIYWQDGRALLYGLKRALLDLQTAPNNRYLTAWQDASWSATIFARSEFNIGRLVPTADLEKTANRLGSVMLGPDSDGYFPVRHALGEGSRKKLTEDVAAMLSGKVPDPHIDPLNEQAYAEIRDTLAKQNIELVLVAPPVKLKDFHAWVDAPPGPRLLKFDDPKLHPEFFDPSHRIDSDHLNDAGAQILTRELARAYLSKHWPCCS